MYVNVYLLYTNTYSFIYLFTGISGVRFELLQYMIENGIPTSQAGWSSPELNCPLIVHIGFGTLLDIQTLDTGTFTNFIYKH